jgi:murein DD-endopeptidase MepM/ murein hydrolase activator NlpD
MDNRFFSLMVVPDSGNDVKSSSFNFKFILYFLGALVLTFFTCLFFIIGYHVKLNQEKDYSTAVKNMRIYEARIEKSKKTYAQLSSKLANIQKNDQALRQFAYMKNLDSDMYLAGIGGHEIVSESDFSGLQGSIKEDVIDLTVKIKKFQSRISVQEKSLDEIVAQLQENISLFNNTPSMLPCLSLAISDDFAWRFHPITHRYEFHDAVDLRGNRGDEIRATHDGVVIMADRQGALGKCVRIKNVYGYETVYGHLDEILVHEGQTVKKKDIIGKMGSTGRTTGVHVHYSVIFMGKPENPNKFY